MTLSVTHIAKETLPPRGETLRLARLREMDRQWSATVNTARPTTDDTDAPRYCATCDTLYTGDHVCTTAGDAR